MQSQYYLRSSTCSNNAIVLSYWRPLNHKDPHQARRPVQFSHRWHKMMNGMAAAISEMRSRKTLKIYKQITQVITPIYYSHNTPIRGNYRSLHQLGESQTFLWKAQWLITTQIPVHHHNNVHHNHSWRVLCRQKRNWGASSLVPPMVVAASGVLVHLNASVTFTIFLDPPVYQLINTITKSQ